jgi:hypothetical protein
VSRPAPFVQRASSTTRATTNRAITTRRPIAAGRYDLHLGVEQLAVRVVASTSVPGDAGARWRHVARRPTAATYKPAPGRHERPPA